MAKMMKPEVKAVRFGGADVIATSALAFGNYIAKQSEGKDASLNGLENDNKTWITLVTDIDGNVSFNGSSYNNPNTDNGDAYNLTYAWYDNDTWQTENKPWYSYNGVFPIGGGDYYNY